MFLLLTDNASPGSSDGIMPGFLVEEGGGMEKLVIVAISINLLTKSLASCDIFTRDSYAKRGICRHRVSVCVSVTFRYCIKTAKRRITQTTPHDSPMTLVF